jgi:hypothetical protein
MPASGPIVAGASGEPVTANGARTEFRKAVHSLGMPWLTLAHARKWAATVADETAGLTAASSLLGHSNSRTTENYLRGGREAARLRAVEAVGGALGRSVGAVKGEESGAAVVETVAGERS